MEPRVHKGGPGLHSCPQFASQHLALCCSRWKDTPGCCTLLSSSIELLVPPQLMAPHGPPCSVTGVQDAVPVLLLHFHICRSGSRQHWDIKVAEPGPDSSRVGWKRSRCQEPSSVMVNTAQASRAGSQAGRLAGSSGAIPDIRCLSAAGLQSHCPQPCCRRGCSFSQGLTPPAVP